MSFIEIFIVLIYFAALIFIAVRKKEPDTILAGRKQNLIVVLFSLLATETSAASLLVFPDLGYNPSFRFNLISMLIGFFLGRLFIARFLIEPLYESGVTSVYELVRKKSGESAYRLFSYFYLIATPLAAGVRLFIAALGIYSLYLVLKIDIESFSLLAGVIITTGIIAILYSMAGGLSGIMKTDFIQFVIIIAGSIILIPFISDGAQPAGTLSWNDFFKINTKMSFYLTKENYAFPLSMIGGFFIVLGSHSIDQTNLQRILASSDLKTAKRAMALSGFFIIPMIMFFMFIGFIIYGSEPGIPAEQKVFPYVIFQHRADWGVYLRPIFLVVFLSAALSSIDSTLHAMGTVTYRLNLKWNKSFRFYSLLSGIVLIFMGVFFLWIHFQSPRSPLISLALGITGMFFTPMAAVLSVLLLKKHACRICPNSILIAMLPAVGVNVLIFFWNYIIVPLNDENLISFSWILGNIASFILAALLLFLRRNSKNFYCSDNTAEADKTLLQELDFFHQKNVNIKSEALKKEASSRKFYRLSFKQNHSVILCEYPCSEGNRITAEIDKWKKTDRCLQNMNLPASRILESKDNLLLISDGGLRDLHDFASSFSIENNDHPDFHPSGKKLEITSEIKTLYNEAIEWLVRLQKYTPKDKAKQIKVWFTTAVYQHELMFFLKNALDFIQLRANLDPYEIRDIRLFFKNISASIDVLEKPVLNHRDFHSRNIMVSNTNSITVIDYQDMRWGNPWYDITSLLYDPYLQLPDEFRDYLFKDFLQRSGHLFNKENEKMYQLTLLQRMIKAAGTYIHQIAAKGRMDYSGPLENALKSISLVTDRVPHPPAFQKIMEHIEFAIMPQQNTDKDSAN